LAHLCCWFVTRHDTPARIRGGSLKREDTSVTLVDSVFLDLEVHKQDCNFSTFNHLFTNAKNGVHQRDGARYLVRNSFPSPIKHQHRMTKQQFDWFSRQDE
jgi:hypothetical protein